MQPFPSVPQAPVDVGITQAPLLQHPVGHDAELQTHWPLTHCCPGWHICPPPQLHAPAVHPSATNGVHETHADPEVPQLPGPGGSQFAPAQQPDGQLLAVHDVQTPVRQFCEVGQGEHMVPPDPQYVLLLPGSHVVPLQHPPGHDVPSQTQEPMTHR
jgi:hypothetical protein